MLLKWDIQVEGKPNWYIELTCCLDGVVAFDGFVIRTKPHTALCIERNQPQALPVM